MKNTVLMSILSVAGLASSAQAAATVQAALVLDNDPRLAAMGVNYGTRALLPGPTATAVGVTLIARVTTTGTDPNYGIMGVGGGGSSSAPNSIFYHNDAVSNQTTALWTSAALAFQRGNTGATGTGRGLMSYNSSGVSHNFRGLIPTGNPEATNASTNASNPQPSNNPYDSQGSGAGSHANGWIGVPSGTGFPSAAGSAVILAVTGQRNSLPDVDGENPFVNFANADADAGTDGNQSAWVALYHLIFVPRANNGGPQDITRDVTVNFSGYFRFGVSAGLTPGGWTLSSSTEGINGLLAGTGSVTFQVPTPGAMALLGLGGLVAGRRRRA